VTGKVIYGATNRMLRAPSSNSYLCLTKFMPKPLLNTTASNGPLIGVKASI